MKKPDFGFRPATNMELADHLTRNHPANKELMELGFGCEVEVSGVLGNDIVRYIRHKGSQMVASFVEDNEVHIFPAEPERIGGNHKILGKPPHLEHYLRVLGAERDTRFEVNVRKYDKESMTVSVPYEDAENNWHLYQSLIKFNLTTGAPATEEDAEVFIELVTD